MRIPATQRLVVEDFPEQRDWIAKMFYVVNRFITDVVAALNGGLVFGENIAGQEKLLDFTYSSTTFPVGFKWTLASRPKALQVLSATQDGNPVIVCAAWEFTDAGNVNVTSMVRFTSVPAVSALNAGSRYKILVRVTP